jgi:hypothetical protein
VFIVEREEDIRFVLDSEEGDSQGGMSPQWRYLGLVESSAKCGRRENGGLIGPPFSVMPGAGLLAI